MKNRTICICIADGGNYSTKLDNLKIDSFKVTEDTGADLVVTASSEILLALMAKETRENEIRKLKDEIGDFGSGYPSDERTIKFLKSFYSDNNKWPTGTRKSWKTLERIRPVKTLNDFGVNNDK